MISIIISTKDKEDLERCSESIKKTISIPYEIISIENKNASFGSLCKVYNSASKKAKFPFLLFIHEDIEFMTDNWGKKIIELLKDEKVGLVGLAGSVYLSKSGKWVEAGVPFVKGRVMHEVKSLNIKQIDAYSDPGTYEVAVVDGIFLATKKKIVEEISFDEKTFDGFHFYDLDFSLRVAKKYKVLVTTDILVKHNSGGKFDSNWEVYRKKFVEKHKSILPFSVVKEVPDWNNIKRWKAQPVDKL